MLKQQVRSTCSLSLLSHSFCFYHLTLPTQAKASGNLAFMGQEEKDHWDKLVDSNIRAGTMACMWCMKAQLVKKTSLAFHKWKFAVAELTWKRSASPGRLNNSSNGHHSSGTVDKHKIHTTGPMSAVLANAINLVHHLKETEVESNLNTRLFMSPSASVNAANAAATSVLQFDTNQLGMRYLIVCPLSRGRFCGN